MKFFRNIVSSVRNIKTIPIRSIFNTSKISTLYLQNKDEKIVKKLRRKGLRYYKSIKFLDNSDYSLLHQIIFDNRKNLFELLVLNCPFVLNKEVVESNSNKLSLTPIQLAACVNNTYFINSLFDLGVNINSKSNGDMNLLHLATYKGSIRAMDVIMNRLKIDINSTTNDKQTALHIACLFGKIDASNLLIEQGANLYDIEAGGLTPLEFCCLGDHRELFNILNNSFYSLTKLDEINQYNSKHISLTHLAATSKAGVKILSELCNDRSNVNSRCKQYSSTPLHFAVLERNIPAIEVLLRNEAFVDAKDYNGNTPIHFATEICNIPILRILFSYGADIHIKNNSGMSAYNIAITQDNKDVQLFYLNSANVKNNSYIIKEEDFMFKKSTKFN